MTLCVAGNRRQLTPEQQRRVVLFGCLAVVPVGLLAVAALSGGALRTVAAIIGLPLMLALFLLARSLGSQ